jgi:hypothetical protein
MPSKTVKAKSKVTSNTRPLPGRINVENVSQKDNLLKFMMNNPTIRVSPVVVPDQKYDPEYTQVDRAFSPVTIPRQTKERSLSDMENARRYSSPVTIGEYMSTLNKEDDDKNDWGHHNKNFFGGSKNRHKNKKKRATKKKLRNKKRQTRRKK